MTTTLAMWNEFSGQNLATSEEALEAFKASDMRTMDRFCGRLVDNLATIGDLAFAANFTHARNAACGIVSSR